MQKFRRLLLAVLISCMSLMAHTVLDSKLAYAQTVSISGTFQYQNASGGLSPIRNARVDIYVNGNGVFAAANTTTNPTTGSFVVNVSASNVTSVQAIVRAITTSISINNDVNIVYSLASVVGSCNSCTSLNLGTMNDTTPNGARAFFIFDQLGTITPNKLFAAPTSWTPPYRIDVIYPVAGGSEFVPTQAKINIHGNANGNATNNDGYYASPITHEYGHAVMNMLFGYYPAIISCNPHGFGTSSSGSCAWTEGWADYFQGWVRGQSNYIFNNNAPQDFESNNSNTFGPSFEQAVAAALWDIDDATNDSAQWDTINLGIGTSITGIWGVLSGATKPVDGPDFLTRWLTMYNASNDQVRSIFAWNGMCARYPVRKHGCSYLPYVIRQY